MSKLPPKRYLHVPGKDLDRIVRRLDAGVPKPARKTRWQVFIETLLEAGGSPLERSIRIALICVGILLTIWQLVR